ncbi:MAG: putative Ig domain-containing protein [Synergistaceae bacterium]|nr:putative Ig domain-containing protein [Synergistaceae bacterium]
MSNKKFFAILVLLLGLSFLLGGCGGGGGGSGDSGSDESGEPILEVDPRSAEFEEWVANGAQPSEQGLIPDPIDRSHLKYNPPIFDDQALAKKTAYIAAYPNDYDLRNSSMLTAIRDQGRFGTCWAHATMAACESNALMQGIGTFDLSEMHLAYFARADPRAGKAFYLASGAEPLRGGNASISAAMFSRLDGPVGESMLAYPSPTSTTYAKPSGNAGSYKPNSLRLIEKWELGDNAGLTGTNRNNFNRMIKNMIYQYGAVYIAYYAGPGATSAPQGQLAKYYLDNGGTADHAVALIGWDDSMDTTSSSSQFPNKASSNGAWLVKNSWGTANCINGYFWMSYEQDISEVTVFIVDQANPNLKHYGYDDLGQCGSIAYNWAANVFKATGNETVTEIAFYTMASNAGYDAYVYKFGTSAPSSPVSGSPAAKVSKSSEPCAGYHTVTLSTPVSLSTGEYFSVVVRTSKSALEVQNPSYSSPVINQKESYFSSSGTSWIDGGAQSTPYNACIKAFTIPSSAAPTPPAITTGATLADATEGTAYSVTLAATGTTPIAWALDSGSLPPGLTLGSDGKISGTPTTPGSYSFTIKASNTAGDDTRAFTLTVKGVAPTVTTASLPDGKQGDAYSATITVTGSKPFTKLNVTGLPTALTATPNPSTGEIAISGTPTDPVNTYSVTVTAENAHGTTTKTLNLKINSGAPVISAIALPDGVEGAAYAGATLTATGPGTVTWSIASGTLPAGLTLNASTGAISGTPSAGTAGKHTFTVQASNTYGATTKTLTLTIKSSIPTITTSSLSQGTEGMAYSATLLASVASTWTLDSGSLPGGLTLGSDGVISGTPTAAGTFTFTVKATSAAGNSVTKTLSITIKQASPSGTKPVIAANNIPNIPVNTDFSITFAVSAGSTPITWELIGGNLPDGLSLASNGTLSGKPTKAATYRFTLKAQNAYGFATQQFQVTIESASSSPVVPVITTSSMTPGIKDEDYSFTFEATGEPTSWQFSGLPDGLEDFPNGLIEGVPEQSGTFTIYVMAGNDAGSSERKTFTLTIRPN